MKKCFISILFLIAGMVCAQAQDVIVKTSGDRIFAKVLEVSETSVKYKKYGNETGPDFIIKKTEFKEIVLEDGEKIPGKVGSSSDDVVIDTPISGGNQRPVANRRPPAPASDYKKGFIGFNLGVASLTEDYSDQNGGFDLEVNFGYLFSKTVGLNSAAFLQLFPVEDEKYSIGFVGATTGPLISIGIGSQRMFDVDINPNIGFAQPFFTGNEYEYKGKLMFVFGLNTGFRWNFSDNLSLTTNLGYRNVKFLSLNFASVIFSAGLNIRLN